MNKAIYKIISLNSMHAFSLYNVLKSCEIFFDNFLGDVTIDVNGKMAFSQIP